MYYTIQSQNIILQITNECNNLIGKTLSVQGL